MAFAYTQFEPMMSDSAQSMSIGTDMNIGIYIPPVGMPMMRADIQVTGVVKMTCLYCDTRHLWDRVKATEHLLALLCLACGAPLPLPKD
jgi:hypothetical protein